MFRLYGLCVFFSLFYERTSCAEVHQIPSLLAKERNSITIQCSHADNNLQQMLWYQQKTGSTDFSLITYAYGTGQATNEDGFKERFTLSKETALKGNLTISNVLQADSAVYYCAASTYTEPAYFGDGTKLTVLERDIKITEPKVKVLNVSENEVCARKNVTLVCVAEGFYPDHVSVAWEIDGESRETDVSTDEFATQGANKLYSISSRLNIFYKDEWAKGYTFTCIVSFYNGTHMTKHEGSIKSNKVDLDEYSAENYVRSVKTTMLAYGMFVAKSLAYGLFIMYIVRRQGLFSK